MLDPCTGTVPGWVIGCVAEVTDIMPGWTLGGGGGGMGLALPVPGVATLLVDPRGCVDGVRWGWVCGTPSGMTAAPGWLPAVDLG